MPKGVTASSSGKKSRVRVWWPPTDDSKRSGYSGAYWPADLLSESGDRAVVQYDNGDKETVFTEYLQPRDPSTGFGKETKALQVGEFVEVSNNSKTDPAEWVGVVTEVKKRQHLCKISYPFHDSVDEDIEIKRLRRARVWDINLGQWLFVQPFQEWDDGEVTSPVELFLCNEKSLFTFLAGDRKKVRVQGRGVARAAEEQIKLPSPALSRGKREAEVKAVKLPAKRHKVGTGGNEDHSQAPSASSQGALRAAVEASKDFSAATEKPSQGRGLQPYNSVPENLTEAGRQSSSGKQKLAEKTFEALPKREASVSPHSAAEASKERTGTAQGAADMQQRQILDVPLSSLVNRRVPSEWIPAPNIGPECFIVPSPNPHEEPHIARLVAGGSPPKEIEPPQPAEASAPAHHPLPNSGVGWESIAASPAAKRPRKKDPNFPRRPQTAYTFFVLRHRPQVKEELGSNSEGHAVTKRLADMWSKVSPEEKAVLQEEAAQDRRRYEEEMRNYVPGLGFNDRGEEEFPDKKQRKDKDAPKRPRSAYILFSSQYRKNAAPQLDFSEATHAAAAAWKGASEETRRRFENEAAIEKDAYDAAMRVYTQHKREQAVKEHAEQHRIANLLQQYQAVHASQRQNAPPQNAASLQNQPPVSLPPDVVAGYPTTTLQRLDLETAKQMLRKERLHPDAYYMLVDAWRHDSPRLENALRAFSLHVDRKAKPDYKAFLVGIYGLEIMRPLMANSNPPPSAKTLA